MKNKKQTQALVFSNGTDLELSQKITARVEDDLGVVIDPEDGQTHVVDSIHTGVSGHGSGNTVIVRVSSYPFVA